MNEPKPNQTPLTRRSFLRTTSTALAGGSLLATMPVERFALGASPGDTIKIAVVGCGGRGTGAADQALVAGGEGVKIVAMADAFQSSVDRALDQLKGHKERLDVKPEHRFVGLDAYKDAIAMADMVILATPPGFRPIHFEEAVKQGKNIFMEKPVAVDGPGVRRVILAAQEAKKKESQSRCRLAEASSAQLHSDHPTAARWRHWRYHRDAGLLGRRSCGPKRQTRHAGQEAGTHSLPKWNIRWPTGTCSLGCAAIILWSNTSTTSMWRIGCSKAIQSAARGWVAARIQKGPDRGEIFDHFNVEYEYEGGVRVFSQCRQIPGFSWNPVSEHAIGTKGTCDVSGFIIQWGEPMAIQGSGRPAEPEQRPSTRALPAAESDPQRQPLQ